MSAGIAQVKALQDAQTAQLDKQYADAAELGFNDLKRKDAEFVKGQMENQGRK